MVDTNYSVGKYGLIARIFNLIGSMPEGEQLFLLNQLLKGNITRHLFKLVLDMSEDEHIRLLEQLEEDSLEDIPITTVDLNGEDSPMRKKPRKACFLGVRFTVDGRPYRSSIIDISTVGVFIETTNTFKVGKDIVLEFVLPNQSKPLKVGGKIVWSGFQGIGVKFINLRRPQEDAVRTFVENRQNGSPLL
jgi:Tfp pilus assembly protein PilZ